MKFSKFILERVDWRQEMESESRRENKEWELGPDCPLEGKKAWALLYYLEYENDIDVLTSEDETRKKEISDEIEKLNELYNQEENTNLELLDKISELEDELDEYGGKVDVYDMIPVGEHYDMTRFEVPKVLGDRGYAVGDEREIQDSAEEYVRNLIQDVGYEGFTASFVKGYLDEDKILDTAERIFDTDIYDNPESYLDEEDRQLSSEQVEKIEILKERISKFNTVIERLEEDLYDDDEENESIQEKIDELQEGVDEMEEEISDIESEPQGDFPEHLYQDAIRNRLDDVRRDPESFLDDYGMNYEDFIDEDEFIKGVIDEDGYGHTLGTYDGSVEEREVLGEYFWICRID